MAQRIIIDTSVFISALIGPKGPARELLRRCFMGQYIPVMGNALFSEYEAVRSRPDIEARCALSAQERDALAQDFYSLCQWVKVHFLWRPNLRDAGDDHLVELALATGADCIATHNLADFRRAELRFPGLVIATPADILTLTKGH
jgi:putative PIN family toxin of toxin-antitoxin system